MQWMASELVGVVTHDAVQMRRVGPAADVGWSPALAFNAQTAGFCEQISIPSATVFTRQPCLRKCNRRAYQEQHKS
jgi:hypothetical protein